MPMTVYGITPLDGHDGAWNGAQGYPNNGNGWAYFQDCRYSRVGNGIILTSYLMSSKFLFKIG
jgi:hypothetical protein